MHHHSIDEVDGRVARFVLVGEALADLEERAVHGPAVDPSEPLMALPAPLLERIRIEMRSEIGRITALFGAIH